MDLQIDWASLTVGSKYTLFVLFYFVFEGNFPSTSPPGGGAFIWRADLTEGFCFTGFGGLCLEGLIHGVGLFSEFNGILASLANLDIYPNEFGLVIFFNGDNMSA